jgi:hypothetical protein
MPMISIRSEKVTSKDSRQRSGEKLRANQLPAQLTGLTETRASKDLIHLLVKCLIVLLFQWPTEHGEFVASDDPHDLGNPEML